jgi:hypothetical protein
MLVVKIILNDVIAMSFTSVLDPHNYLGSGH